VDVWVPGRGMSEKGPTDTGSLSEYNAAIADTLVKSLHGEKGLLLDPGIADEPFQVPAILNAGQKAFGRAEIFQDPGGGSTQERNAPQHRNIVGDHPVLELFGPPFPGAA